ncbi:MAG: glycosyltransferase family 39 protein, partial [Planctomycetota bacterium]
MEQTQTADAVSAGGLAGGGSWFERRVVAWCTLGLVISAAAAVRFYRLGALPLWGDEGATVRFANKPLGVLWGPEAVKETNPPLFYTVQHFWRVFGESEAALRSFSAACGVAVVALTYSFAAGIAPAATRRRTGLIAAALSALSVEQIHHGRDARAYVMMTLLVVGVLLSLSYLMRHAAAAARPMWQIGGGADGPGGRGRWAAWLGYVVCATLLLYTHNTAV